MTSAALTRREESDPLIFGSMSTPTDTPSQEPLPSPTIAKLSNDLGNVTILSSTSPREDRPPSLALKRTNAFHAALTNPFYEKVPNILPVATHNPAATEHTGEELKRKAEEPIFRFESNKKATPEKLMEAT